MYNKATKNAIMDKFTHSEPHLFKQDNYAYGDFPRNSKCSSFRLVLQYITL